MSAVNKTDVGKPPRPRIRVQLDVKSQDNEDQTSENTSSGLRVSFSGSKRTDLNLFRAPSPANGGEVHLHHLSLPTTRCGRGGSTVSMHDDTTAYGYVDEKVLLKSFETLANALGFKKKSFSTNDILAIDGVLEPKRLPHRSQSDMQLTELIPISKLEANSRSLSTWVAVGDTSATTQLPSPQARLSTSSPNFTAADLIRSVNKRIRQAYLKKRVFSTYKALERMTQSGFNLDRLQDVVNEAELPPGLVRTHQSTRSSSTTRAEKSLSSREIERDRGKPLSKYERNVMIFDWLHTLDESATADLN